MPSKRPTILQIIPELDTGGAELSAIEIAGAIVEAGGRALVLSQGGRLASQITACGGEFLTFPAGTKNPLRMLWNVGGIARLIESEGVDLVHARSRAPAWSTLLAARIKSKPFVTTYHGAYGENGPLKKFYNSVMARGDIVIANSGYTRDLIRSRYGTADERIRVIHRGVDGAVFDPAALAPERVNVLRKKWNLRPDDRVVLQAARLTGWKGQRVLIEAARLLNSAGKLENVRVILAGDTQGRETYSDALKDQIRDAGLEHHVHLVGHIDDVVAAFGLACVTVVASTEPEAFGRTATEAQVMGCPVIATDLGAPPETVLAAPRTEAGSITGWLVKPSDPQAMAAVLEACLALPEPGRAKMGKRAREHVLRHFSLHSMRTATLNVYDSLLGTSLAHALKASEAKKSPIQRPPVS